MLKQPQVIKSDDLRLFHLLRTGSAPGGSPYKAADIQSLCQQYLPRDFKGMVKAVLEVEAPLSEELFLRRIVWLFGRVRTPLKKCSLTADDGASPPLEWCTASAEMVHGGRGRGAPGRHAGDYSGMPLRLRMDSPSIWMV